jgi:hypothetical protein
MAGRWNSNAIPGQKLLRSVVESDRRIWLVDRVEELVLVATFWITES